MTKRSILRCAHRWAAVISAGFAVVLVVSAQDAGQSVYLLQANPFGFHEKYPATLFVLREGSGTLKRVREVAHDSMEAVHINYDARLATVVVDSARGTNVELIDFNTAWLPSRLEFEYGGRGAQESYLISDPSLGVFQTIELSPLDRNVSSFDEPSLPHFESTPGYVVLSLPVGKRALAEPKVQEIELREYNHIRVGGEAQPGVAAADYVMLSTLADGTIAVLAPYVMVSLGIKAPAALLTAGPGQILLGSVCSNELLVISRDEDTATGSGSLGSALIYAYNKQSEKWHTIKVPGDAPSVRGFGPFVAVMVAESTKDPMPSPLANRKVVTGIELQNEELRKLKRFKPSPGMELASEEERDTGVAARTRFQDAEIYAPGKLIVYDTRTGKQALIETKHGDSEILFVSENSVIYRVDQAIYLAKYDGTSISEARVLIKDKAIADVHWAFWGPEER